MKKDYKGLSKKFKEALDKITPEDIEKYFPEDKTPKGWLSIEEHLPQLMVEDFINKGYSTYKVKDKDGNEFESDVTDHHMWYYMAKDVGITHWFNK